MNGRWEVYQPNTLYTGQLHLLYLPEKQAHWQNFPSSGWGCWADAGIADVRVSIYFGWQRTTVCHWKMLRMVKGGTIFFHRARNVLCHVAVAALSFWMLRLSPGIRVSSWQATNKNLKHCSLVDLVSVFTTTQLHKKQVLKRDTEFCFYLFDAFCS